MAKIDIDYGSVEIGIDNKISMSIGGLFQVVYFICRDGHRW